MVELDARGLQCPGPIMAVYKRMQDMAPGQVLRVQATDPGFGRDVRAWAQSTGNRFMDLQQQGGMLTAWIAKAEAATSSVDAAVSVAPALAKERTIIVFSGDFDRAMAAFILANGALAAGQKVTMFFTFWGLNILRKPEGAPVNKKLIEKMFGWMMPRGADKLKLSKMNMGGMGTAMMQMVMKQKNVDALPALIKAAQDAGARMIACQMTMDIMGLKPEELIDGVEVGGVATYALASETAGVNLFI